MNHGHEHNNGWMPIATAPRDRRVLVYSPKYGETFAAFLGINPEDGDEQWVIARTPGMTFIVPDASHWQPEPKPPEDVK